MSGYQWPMLPALYSTPDNPLTEDRIERAVERKTDLADSIFLHGGCSRTDYDIRMNQINQWALNLYNGAEYRRVFT